MPWPELSRGRNSPVRGNSAAGQGGAHAEAGSTATGGCGRGGHDPVVGAQGSAGEDAGDYGGSLGMAMATSPSCRHAVMPLCRRGLPPARIASHALGVRRCRYRDGKRQGRHGWPHIESASSDAAVALPVRLLLPLLLAPRKLVTSSSWRFPPRILATTALVCLQARAAARRVTTYAVAASLITAPSVTMTRPASAMATPIQRSVVISPGLVNHGWWWRQPRAALACATAYRHNGMPRQGSGATQVGRERLGAVRCPR